MKTFLLVSCCAVLVGCASGVDRVHLDESPGARYPDKDALTATISALQDLKYPLTRAETLTKLGLSERRLPSLVSIEATGSTVIPQHRETLSLTDPVKKGRRYVIELWYDRSARELSGEAFAEAKIVRYAELIAEDDGSGEAPKARYLLQASQYPYVKLTPPLPDSEK